MFPQNISCEDAQRLLKEENGQLVDVRSPMEYAQGSLPNAVNVPLQTIHVANDLLEKRRPIILYCVTGTRTRMAKTYLDAMGFENEHDLGSFRNYMRC